jgi:hypothetical protein
LDHLEEYRGELQTLMTEKFHIIDTVLSRNGEPRKPNSIP